MLYIIYFTVEVSLPVDLVHTLKTVKGLLVLVPPRTPRSSGYDVYTHAFEVWVLGVGMSTLGAQTVVRRGSGDPSTDGPAVWQHLIGPDFPSIETRQLGRGFQIGMFRPIRLDHTNCLQVAIKTH
jgi:hypothetical protein